MPKDDQPSTPKFPGFRSPAYTQVPDELFDELLAVLSGAELKVLLYIVRRTFGFKKGSDRVSKAQLENGIRRADGTVVDRGTGLSRRAVRLAVDALVERGILLKLTHSSPERGNEATEYALHLQDQAIPGVLSTQAGGQKVPKPLGRGVPPQETTTQETVLQHHHQPPTPVPASTTTPQDDDELLTLLTGRGVGKTQARRLVEAHGPTIRERVAEFDWRLKRQPSSVGKNPAGFLVASIRQPDDYPTPDEYRQAQTREATRQRHAEEQATAERQRLVEEARIHAADPEQRARNTLTIREQASQKLFRRAPTPPDQLEQQITALADRFRQDAHAFFADHPDLLAVVQHSPAIEHQSTASGSTVSPP